MLHRISFFIIFIITVSKHIASGGRHDQVLAWLKTGEYQATWTPADSKYQDQNSELNFSNGDFDENLTNFDADEVINDENEYFLAENSEKTMAQHHQNNPHEDFEEDWFNLIEMHQMDQYAKRTIKSIKNWFTLIPNEEDMKKSGFRYVGEKILFFS